MDEVATVVRVELASGQPCELIVGHEYEITTKFRTQRYGRRNRMSFLGEYAGGLQWNARPAAGTQEVPARNIFVVTNLGRSLGRDDDLRYVNRDARLPDPYCPSCNRNDHEHHQYDFLASGDRVTLCRCPRHRKVRR